MVFLQPIASKRQAKRKLLIYKRRGFGKRILVYRAGASFWSKGRKDTIPQTPIHPFELSSLLGLLQGSFYILVSLFVGLTMNTLGQFSEQWQTLLKFGQRGNTLTDTGNTVITLIPKPFNQIIRLRP